MEMIGFWLLNQLLTFKKKKNGLAFFPPKSSLVTYKMTRNEITTISWLE
jgi:hypothetical protein